MTEQVNMTIVVFLGIAGVIALIGHFAGGCQAHTEEMQLRKMTECLRAHTVAECKLMELAR